MSGSAPTLWVIVGATGTGKTELSLKLASQIKNKKRSGLISTPEPHIINADSMQFYRGMNIGTAKLTEPERSGIEHHFFDVLDVTEEATVAWYQPLARKLISGLLSAGHDVILVGGSGLYVSSVIYDFEFPPRDETLRAAVQDRFDREGIVPLMERLRELAPHVADTVDSRNPRRVIRALELAESGASAQTVLPKKPALWYENTRIFGVAVDRTQLVSRLDERVIKMWEDGLVGEVQQLLEVGIEEGPTASRAIGYQQAISQLKGEITEQEAIAQTQALTRRYARRQVSWFKRYPEIEWLDGSNELPVDVFSNIKCTSVLASGQYFCLYVDADASKPLTAQVAKQICNSGEDHPFHGVIRAVPTERMGVEGEANLAEEPTARWFLDQRDFAGRQIQLSGNGLRAFVKFLLDTELHTMSDRRETLPVATRSGVRDTLVGVVGVSADLGRWRLRESTDISLLIELGQLHSVRFFDEQHDDLEALAEQFVGDQTVLVDQSTISVVDAVGHVGAKFLVVDLDGVQREVPSSGTGAVAAALFARHFCVETMVPNHWRVETAGGPLGVRMFAAEDGEHVSINGPAEVIL